MEMLEAHRHLSVGQGTLCYERLCSILSPGVDHQPCFPRGRVEGWKSQIPSCLHVNAMKLIFESVIHDAL